VLADLFVDGIAMFEHAADERFGEETDGGLVGGRGWEFDGLAPGRAAFLFRNRGHPLRVPELPQRGFEVVRRIQVVLEQELYSPFPRFSSLAHRSRTMPQNEPVRKRKFRGARFVAAEVRRRRVENNVLDCG